MRFLTTEETMDKEIIFLGLVLATLGTGVITMVVKHETADRPCYSRREDIENLFAHSKEEVEKQFQDATTQLKDDIAALIAIDDAERTFDNTFAELDRALERFNIVYTSIYALSIVTPDEAVRTAAQMIVPKFAELYIDLITLNMDLYTALEAYTKRLEKEILAKEQNYFIEETMRGFKRSGLLLPKKEQDRLRELKKEQAQLSVDFEKNIAAADETITVDKEGLKGLEDSFIECLKKTEEGGYSIPTDYAHYYKVMEQSEVADTRKRLYRAFNRRGYPENDPILRKILALSDEMAKLLGYESSAAYTLEEEMAKAPAKVSAFLEDIRIRAWEKAKQETALMMKEVPEGVEVVDNKFYPWDSTFVFNRYKQKHFKVDEAQVAEYFPLDYTLPALLGIYKDFFGLQFNKLKDATFWHVEVQAYAVYQGETYRGMILLDLFPRPFKYSHAGHISIVPAVKDSRGKILPSVALVMANFPRAHGDRPSLLKRSEVTTFFHEFGHALHALLGATELASFSGTSVKHDFVEMPSQMLEEWLWDPTILKRISSHYQTKESLPDEIITNIIGLKQFGKADSVVRQGYLAALSLACYQPGADKDPYVIMNELANKLTQGQHVDPESRFYASFGHLTGYGPRYYGYLWSKVFALDLFSAIKPHGLTNKEIGTKYADLVLSKGGSKEPEELLEEFLGRKPSSDAFFNDIGI